eukprot:1422634-Amphidinium_carterae.1
MEEAKEWRAQLFRRGVNYAQSLVDLQWRSGGRVSQYKTGKASLSAQGIASSTAAAVSYTHLRAHETEADL